MKNQNQDQQRLTKLGRNAASLEGIKENIFEMNMKILVIQVNTRHTFLEVSNNRAKKK
jgi:hypothetical protein